MTPKARSVKENNCYNELQQKNFYSMKALVSQWKDKPQSGEKYSAVNKRFIYRIYKKSQIIKDNILKILVLPGTYIRNQARNYLNIY